MFDRKRQAALSRLSLKTILRFAALLFASGCLSEFAPRAYALDSTDVLPRGINSPALRVGQVDGIGQRYDSHGNLMSLGDINSVEFDAHQLSKIEPQVNELVQALNQFGHQKLGDSLYLGTLHVNTEPQVTYLAPMHAYGVTSHWTVAIGVPVVRYRNKLSLSETGSNIQQIEDQVGTASTDINKAFSRLKVSLVQSAQQEIADKGYKPLVDRDQTMLGDIQLASIYQFHKSSNWSAAFRTLVELPTGPSQDPDDLADLGIFGETAVEPGLVASHYLGHGFVVGSSIYVHVPIPDRVTRRVPLNEDDTLPDQDSKHLLYRQLGVSGGVDSSISYNFSSRLQAGVGYEFFSKAADHYSGTSYGDMSLLASETNQLAQRVHLAMSYSSVEAYMHHEAILPTIVSIDLSDTVRGVNIERRLVQELWLTMFF